MDVVAVTRSLNAYATQYGTMFQRAYSPQTPKCAGNLPPAIEQSRRRIDPNRVCWDVLVGLDWAQGVQQLAYEHGQSSWHSHEQMDPSTDYVIASGSANSLNRLPGKVHNLAWRFQNGALSAIGAVEVDISPERPRFIF